MNFFPPGAYAGTEGAMVRASEELNWAVERVSQSTFWDRGEGRAGYLIWRYASERRARSLYSTIVNINRSDGQGPCLALQTLRMSADEYVVSCGESGFGGVRAEMVARYKEFVVSVGATIDEKMSFSMFIDIVHFVDGLISGLVAE